MGDGKAFAFVKIKGDDIESAFYIEQVFFCAVAQGDFFYLFLFFRSDRFFREAGRVAPSRFDFDKNENWTVIGDDIDFSPKEAETFFDNPVFILF